MLRRLNSCLFISLALFLLLSVGARGSNLQITSVGIEQKDTVAGTAYVKFDLSWDFSWKDRLHQNWDAAWIFVKFYDPRQSVWKHAYLEEPQGTPVAGKSGNFMSLPHSMGTSNVTMWSEFATTYTDFGEKVSGVYIYRKKVGNGSVEVKDIMLKWHYTDQGMLAGDALQVMVFGIEMVYIPPGPFIIGDGVSTQALYMDGNNLIIKTNVVTGQSSLMGKVKGETSITYLGTTVPDIFPKGYKGFYLMKYEISQHAYADFLNTLTVPQQTTRTSSTPVSAVGTLAMVPPKYASNPMQYRNCIRVRVSALPAQSDIPARPAIYGLSVTGASNDQAWEMESNGGNIACNFLSWDDGLAYLDWACLRPMTEMEYEKACRGTRFVRREMAWGYQYGNSANKTGIENPFLSNECAKDPSSCYIETGKAPWVMRVGCFAKDSTRRNQAGATFYGVLNMSDNVWERCVNVSTAEGRSFIPRQGDGQLDDNGDAQVYIDIYSDESCWPTAAGGGFRGFQVSNRQYAQSQYVIVNEGERTPWSGFRGCSYAPDNTRFEL